MKTVVLDLDETLIHCTKDKLGDHTVHIPVTGGDSIEVS